MTDIIHPSAKVSEVRWLGPLLVLAGGTCIGFAPIGLRLGIGLGEDGLGPQAIAFWRYTFAVPLIFAMTVLAHKRLPVRPNRYVIMAGVFFALNVGAWHWSLTLTTVANSIFIVNLGNIGVGFMAWLFLKERLSRNWVIAIAVALIGAALLTQGGGEGAKGNVRGDALAVVGAVLVSGYMLCGKVARRTIGGLEVLFWATLVAVGVAGVVTFVAGETFLPARPEGWHAPLLLAVIVQCGGQGLILAGLGRTSAAIAGVCVLVQPVVAAAVSWRFFDEPLLALQVLGAGLILVAVALSQTGQKAKTEP